MVMSVVFQRIDGRAYAGGRRGPRVAVRRALRDRGLDPPHTSGTPHGRARLVTGNYGQHDLHACVLREVARYRLGRPQQT